MSAEITTPCAAGWRTNDRVKRIEDDLEKLCGRLEQQNSAILATLREMQRETVERFDQWTSRDNARATLMDAKVATIERELDRVGGRADIVRSVIVGSTGVVIAVATAIVVLLLRGGS